jgi:hypothetical protein
MRARMLVSSLRNTEESDDGDEVDDPGESTDEEMANIY